MLLFCLLSSLVKLSLSRQVTWKVDAYLQEKITFISVSSCFAGVAFPKSLLKMYKVSMSTVSYESQV